MRPVVSVMFVVASAVAIPQAARAESMFCVIAEPQLDGNVFVSTAFKLPGNPDDDASAATYAEAFEKHVRSRYSFEDGQPLINFTCIRSADADAGAERAKVYRRKGNTKTGAVIRTEVAWAPDDGLHQLSRSRRKNERDLEQALSSIAMTIRGYLYCKHLYEESADAVTVTLSEVMMIPGGARVSDFATFTADRFRTAVLEQRRKDNKPTSGRDHASCDVMAQSKNDVVFARKAASTSAKAPIGGDSYGEPDDRELVKLSLSTFTWSLNGPGYHDYGAAASAFDARVRKLTDALRFATNARRRRDCMAGKTSACGPTPVP